MSNLEKTNLEAHVDLCAERYRNLDASLQRLESRLDNMQTVLNELSKKFSGHQTHSVERYLTWGGVIITTLVGIVTYLLIN
jgi:hypothetical protein